MARFVKVYAKWLTRPSQHLKTHSKPWKCDLCLKGFGLRADLNRHVRSRHRAGHRMFTCEICKTTYTRKDNLTQHISRKHVNNHNSDIELRSTISSFTILEKEAPSKTDWLLFMQSASNGNTTVVSDLLTSHLDVNIRADDGNTALHCAAFTGHIDVVQLLIQHGADLEAKNRSRRSPLYEAAVGGQAECMLFLLQAGCTLPYYTHDGLGRSFALGVVQTGDLRLVQNVVAATRKFQCRASIVSLAILAAEVNQVPVLEYLYSSSDNLMASYPENLHRQSGHPKPLHYAVRKGQQAAVEYLLWQCDISKGCDKLLELAAGKGHTAICRLLCSHCSESGDSILLAARRGHLETVQTLVAFWEPNGDALCNIGNAAFWNDHLDITQFISSHRAAKVTDKLSRLEVLKILLPWQAISINDSGEKIHQRRRCDPTLLFIGAEQNDLDLTTFVLEHKDLGSKTMEVSTPWPGRTWGDPKKTALDVAQILGHSDIANLLISHGATNHDVAPKAQSQPVHNQANSLPQDSVDDSKMREWSDDSSDLNSEA